MVRQFAGLCLAFCEQNTVLYDSVHPPFVNRIPSCTTVFIPLQTLSEFTFLFFFPLSVSLPSAA
jgi:hypothetical protein